MEPRSLALQVDSLPAEPQEAQEYWSGWPIPSPGDHPDPGFKPGSPAVQVDSLPAELPGVYINSASNLGLLVHF